jgi:deazaflavin-dependent oxidoreductase (nitroreductase family)
MPLTGEYQPSTSEWARTQAERFEASGGTEANLLRGVPIIVLTTVGAKSGALRKTALMRVEHDGRYAVVASKGGAPDEPKWGENMRRHPHVELQDGAVKRDYLARELSGDERAEWWGRSIEVWPDYDVYQTKTDRQIALFVLEPIEH